MEAGQVPSEIAAWFAGRGWRVRRHQAEMLAAAEAGRHALLVADTGAGKTADKKAAKKVAPAKTAAPSKTAPGRRPTVCTPSTFRR